MAAGTPAPEDSPMMMAAVAESATTQSMTSSTIRVVEIEDQSNIECQKVLAIALTTDPQDCHRWTQQVVDRSKSAVEPREHIGHLFESQMESERRIKELANIEKLEVAEITLQEARAQATEIVYAVWLDDAANRTPEDIAADSSCENHSVQDHAEYGSNDSHREGATTFKE